MDVSKALEQRRSTRAFRPDPVAGEVVREILDRARRAPSGGNLQPWKVYALAGAPLGSFKRMIDDKWRSGAREKPEYQVYPPALWEPLRSRRRAAGALRFAALGCDDKDEAATADLSARNQAFFGAPVGLFFCLDRRCGVPQWSDLGMYMLAVMLLAEERGLATCAQESWSNWPASIAEFLALPDDLMVFAGMALGHPDPDHPLNGFRTDRASLADLAEFRGL